MGMPGGPPPGAGPPPDMGAPPGAGLPGGASPPSGITLIVQLPHTVDPSMVDQLISAVHRMGGQAQPEAEPMEPDQDDLAGAGPPPGGVPGDNMGGPPPGMPPGPPPNGLLPPSNVPLPAPGGGPAGLPPGPPPPGPGEELPPPMAFGNSGIKRPSSLRTPVKKKTAKK